MNVFGEETREKSACSGTWYCTSNMLCVF